MSPSAWKKTRRGADRFGEILALVAGITCLALPVIVLFFVTVRALYPKGMPLWSVDICQLLLWFLTYLAAAYVFRAGRHVRVTVFVERFSGRPKEFVELATALVCLGAGALMAAAGTRAAVVSWLERRGTYNDVPEYLFAAVIPIGLVMMVYEMVVFVAASLKRPGH